MPTAAGPLSLSTRFHCAAITSKARSHETRWKLGGRAQAATTPVSKR
jgi:hypothetical protein